MNVSACVCLSPRIAAVSTIPLETDLHVRRESLSRSSCWLDYYTGGGIGHGAFLSLSVLGLSTNLPGEDLHARRKVSVCVSSDGGLDFYQGGT